MKDVNNEEKKQSKFGRFLYAIFVNNLPYKIAAIVCGAVIWLLMAGM
ncbi:MAG: hypothetical protein IKM16_02675 [Clostridia bacterium]|nr:hypothetical protein [Clostridia bacterium]MBQ7224066.1 hypothetical protein [Clostridia bacterium]MBR6773552.1 hypothetical protein [Clostridia bacterium]MBR7140947.1 hypothetical protein [Clostridia bacterium]